MKNEKKMKSKMGLRNCLWRVGLYLHRQSLLSQVAIVTHLSGLAFASV